MRKLLKFDGGVRTLWGFVCIVVPVPTPLPSGVGRPRCPQHLGRGGPYFPVVSAKDGRWVSSVHFFPGLVNNPGGGGGDDPGVGTGESEGDISAEGQTATLTRTGHPLPSPTGRPVPPSPRPSLPVVRRTLDPSDPRFPSLPHPPR